MLPRSVRLTRARDFDYVFKRGKSVRSEGIALKIIQTGLKQNRFAVVVSKKVEQKAVKRNKIRRLLTEAIQLYAKNIQKGFDMVFVVLPGFKGESLKEADSIIKQLFQRAYLFLYSS